jgi:hypothetical protein
MATLPTRRASLHLHVFARLYQQAGQAVQPNVLVPAHSGAVRAVMGDFVGDVGMNKIK